MRNVSQCTRKMASVNSKNFLQFKGCLFGIYIKKYCQFTELGPTSNWPMDLPKYRENVIQGLNMK